MAMDDETRARFRADTDRRRQEMKVALDEIKRALEISPAISGYLPYGGEPALAIVSGEISDLANGDLRVTFFWIDGPRGHNTHRDLDGIAKEIKDSMIGPYHPMTEAEVIEFTSSSSFVEGSQQIALSQADNTLRYLAGRAGRYEWARSITDQAMQIARDGDIDGALEILYRAIRELPVANPRIAGFVANPPWVTRALADTYEDIETKVPSDWLPQLRQVDADGAGITAAFLEYGCGAYGCVLATLDPDTVLKVTSDESEADFAIKLSHELVADVCVEYRMAVRISTTHDGRAVYFLWRESANKVGLIDREPGWGKQADDLIHAQHAAAQVAYQAFYEKRPAHQVAVLVNDWLEACEDMKRVRALRPLADGLREVWEVQGVLFGDIHAGNLGLVRRASGDLWVITDPGNVAVVR